MGSSNASWFAGGYWKRMRVASSRLTLSRPREKACHSAPGRTGVGSESGSQTPWGWLLFFLFRLSVLPQAGVQSRLMFRLTSAVQLIQGIIRVIEATCTLRRKYYRAGEREVKSQKSRVKTQESKVERQRRSSKLKAQRPNQGQEPEIKGQDSNVKSQYDGTGRSSGFESWLSSICILRSALCTLHFRSSF
jgi:hypothetical protein